MNQNFNSFKITLAIALILVSISCRMCENLSSEIKYLNEIANNDKESSGSESFDQNIKAKQIARIRLLNHLIKQDMVENSKSNYVNESDQENDENVDLISLIKYLKSRKQNQKDKRGMKTVALGFGRK